jgi:hypothetical protein
VPPPSSADQWTASFRVVIAAPFARARPPAGPIEVLEEGRGGRLRLALVLRAEAGFEPYGRSTGLDISKKLIWPIFMPK